MGHGRPTLARRPLASPVTHAVEGWQFVAVNKDWDARLQFTGCVAHRRRGHSGITAASIAPKGRCGRSRAWSAVTGDAPPFRQAERCFPQRWVWTE